jgi:dTDP-4-amino-4,6-dideoxygalactose transaminase
MPAKMDQLKEICRKYDVTILEDAAEALGSTYFQQPCGSFGDLSALSFNGNKIITTSGGGALLGNDQKLIEKAKFLATQARDQAPHYQHSTIGYNYRLSNISAAIGLGQLEYLQDRVVQRRNNFSRYQKYFQSWNDHTEVDFLEEPDGFFSNRWLTTITVKTQNNSMKVNEFIRRELDKFNIESRPLWKPMHLQPVFKGAKYYGGKVSEELFGTGLCLPSGSNLTNDDFDRIFSALDKISSKIVS